MLKHPVAPGARRQDFPGGTVRARLLGLVLRSTVKPLLGIWARYPLAPWPYAAIDHVGKLLTVAPGSSTTPVRLPNCDARLVSPPEPRDQHTVLYLHGGGFYVGHQHLHRQMVARFATRLGSAVLAVNYRMLPHHAVGDSIADCVDGYRHLVRSGIAPSEIVIMGDSAGGYLALMTTIEAIEQGMPAPAAVVAMSPLADWSPAGKLGAPTSTTCDVFPARAVPVLTAQAEAARQRSRTRAGRAPLRSPVDCDLARLPPVLIQASSREMVYPDAVHLAERLADHGVECTLQVWRDQVHVFQAAAGIVPESARAVAQIAAFVDGIASARSRQRLLRA
ncbi:alpha/beta hydrolase [Hoyosella sp. G463]|uniref:Alpha/beta hydrolase n=1 Tax=Lolliginicoccus lacisalsi TaxID=2742202 RepID=A0A927JA07_9ACTN|nr:alpha/beta hydrolase [Lolliginicoccus lacisalsi]